VRTQLCLRTRTLPLAPLPLSPAIAGPGFFDHRDQRNCAWAHSPLGLRLMRIDRASSLSPPTCIPIPIPVPLEINHITLSPFPLHHNTSYNLSPILSSSLIWSILFINESQYTHNRSLKYCYASPLRSAHRTL